jgi:hypothetical protein
MNYLKRNTLKIVESYFELRQSQMTPLDGFLKSYFK